MNERSRIVDLITRTADPYKQGVGTSPTLGDRGSSLIDIPRTPTASQRNRYWFALQSERVGRNEDLLILGISQALRIGFTQTITLQLGDPPAPFNIEQRIDIPVRDPDFDFTDGDVSWHLRFIPGKVDEGDLGGTQNTLIRQQYPSSQGLMGLQLTPTYVAPPGPIPGDPVGSLGTWNDLRFLRERPTDSLRYHITGPGVLLYIATVHQTDPATRLPWAFPQNFNSSSLTDEQKFVIENPTLIRYTRIGGRLLVDRRQKRARLPDDTSLPIVTENE